MSNRRVIFWLLSLTGMALAVNFVLAWRAPVEVPLSNRVLLDDAASVSTISIFRQGEPETVLSKTDRWSLVAPYAAPVDEQLVLRMLDAFSYATVEDSLSESERIRLGRSREDFGLAVPRLTVSFSDGVSEGVEVSFGTLTPSTNAVYASRAGSSSVFVVPHAVFASANLGAEAFRERTVFPFEPDFVTGFDLTRPGRKSVFFVRDGENWNLDGKTASRVKIREFLSSLADARAKSFVWPTGATNEAPAVSAALLAGYGLDADSALSVNLHCEDGVDRLFLLGHDVGASETYALVYGGTAVVTLPSSLKASALQEDRTFVDARLFPLDESAVTSFTITDGETPYVVASAGEGGWRLDSPIAAPANAETVGAVLGRLLSLTQADESAAGLKVSVFQDRQTVTVAPKSLLGERRLDDLRSLDILKIDPALVKRLVSTPGGWTPGPSTSVVRSGERRAWREEVEGRADRPVDETRVADILSALNPLRASSIVTLKTSVSGLARYGLEEPAHTLAVDQDRVESVRRNILIGYETSDGYYATVGSSEAIFVLPKKTVAALTAGLLAP